MTSQKDETQGNNNEGQIFHLERFNLTGKLPDVNGHLLADDGVNQSEADLDRQTKLEEELLERRQIIADKSLISALKIVTELRRA
jgi:hypothetical protein